MDLKVIENPDKVDIWKVALSLRDIDRKEAFLTTGQTPAKTVVQSCLDCTYLWVTKTRTNNKPIALFGVQEITPTFGVPWMVATNDLKDSARAFLRASKYWVSYLQENFQYLFNFCLPENKTSIRWLKRVGFEFDSKLTLYGYFNHPFLQFWRM